VCGPGPSHRPGLQEDSERGPQDGGQSPGA
jgi:hypothetical protein